MKYVTTRSVACLVLASWVMPEAARAQTIAPLELPGYVEPGQTVSLTDTKGTKTTGRVESLTESAIALLLEGGQRQTIPSASLKRVVIKDSVKNGALIGLIAGAVPGVLIGVGWQTYCTNEATSCPSAPLIFGALFAGAGAGIGAGVDGLIHRRITIAPVIRSANRYGVRDPVARRRLSEGGSPAKGIQISFRF